MASSSTVFQPFSAGDRLLLSYPLKGGEPCVVSSDPESWAQQTAWDLRENDIDRWLDARHGAKPEQFWTADFIEKRGTKYCELVLKYIIMFNHEEVGGHAVMWMDQMIMTWPHYFPYSMKYRCHIDQLFEPDQIDHYGRVFLTRVVEFCHLTYLANQAYWDDILENPPLNERLDEFVAAWCADHKPEKLKKMHIVPECRPDQWPAEYFAAARGKTSLPQAQINKKATEQRQFSGSGNNGVRGDENSPSQPWGADTQTNTNCGADHATNKADSQTTAQTGKGKQAGTEAPILGAGGGAPGGNDGDDSNPEDKPSPSTTPTSPKGKKPVTSDGLKVPVSFSRRSKSESHSPDKHKSRPTNLSLADWMNAPGVERRAVSTQSRSNRLANAMEEAGGELPRHGRGGAEQAIGRYQYQAGQPTPVFQHAYNHDDLITNNAVYICHQDHNFSRHLPARPDHATTYRPGSNIHQTNPHIPGMFVPIPQPQPHTSHLPYGQHNYIPTNGRPLQNHPSSAISASSPHTSQTGRPGPSAPSPYPYPVLLTAPHGVVPPQIIEPYLAYAQAGHWHQVPEPLAYVGVQPRHPGVPPIRQPFVMPPLQQQGVVLGPHHITSPMVRPNAGPQVHANRSPSVTSTPYMGGQGVRGGRRPDVRTDPVHSSYSQPEFPPPRHNSAQHGYYGTNVPTGPMAGHAPNVGRPRRMSSFVNVRRLPSTSGETVQFPSYRDEMVDVANLTEGEQCTSTTIGPDAEDVVTLWLGDIPPNSTADQLKAFMEQMMPIVEVRSPIAYDIKQNYGKGWTFVKFVSNSDARTALRIFQRAEFNGGNLKVQVPERRTREGIQRQLSPGESAYGRYGKSQSIGSPGGAAGHNLSFSGGGTPSRFAGLGPLTDPRTARGSSMSQAIHAVRRNSTFTQQDARSDLPLPDVSETGEPSKPPTPEHEQLPHQPPEQPEQPEHEEPEQTDILKKPKKKKNKKKKRNRKSCDASIAASDSNMSSQAEASGSSRDAIHVVQPIGVESASSALLETARTAEAGAIDGAPAISTTNEPEPVISDKVSMATEGVDNSHAEGSVAADVCVDQSSVLEEETGDSGAEIDEDDHVQEVQPPLLETQAGLTELVFKYREYAESEPRDHDDIAEVDASEIRSEFTTVIGDQQGQDAAKASKKKKGAAQTESFSIFSTRKKTKGEKKKARKAKEAARKASKGSAVVTGAGQDKPPNQHEDAEDTAMPGDSQVETNGGAVASGSKGKGKQVVQHGVHESSSLPGTPTTAREYQPSAPNTPMAKIIKLSQDSTPADAALEDSRADELSTEAAVGGEVTGPTSLTQAKTTSRRSSILGTFNTDSTVSNSKESIDPINQTSYPHPHNPSDDFSVSKLKKENTKSALTYAQAAKNKNNRATTTTSTGFGLSERDVNVPR